MKIKIWNAFASNNSGSYVIVGRFPTEALAADVAAELLAVAQAHTAWLAAPAGGSPLAALAAKHGIAHADDNHDDAWPEHGGKDHPEVFAIGHQVFVQADYTVTMPRLLGHVMYERGGRVETEVDHAHHPIVATFTCWIPWQERADDTADRVRFVVDALCADDGALALPQRAAIPPAWRGVMEGEAPFGEGDLVIGVAFADLRAGFLAVAAAAAAYGMSVRVHVAEAVGDPFAHLRPSAPPTTHALVDVWLDEIGLAPTNLTKTIALARHIGHTEARQLVDRAPVVVLASVTLARAEALRAELSVGNAVVTLRASAASSRVGGL